ncbi:nuclear transport factor 2 family protein [Roseomonas xinghualingensis]|uniref:nuclear transport factor 2 family protein n=1 Tax=Roseomonas xinghualingensis TaxID=2986475 RepID=UPI0021F137DA|nr:nuclear transport factor 2 family protein [Roseomonas sp. SXEYE001]MCV4208973.1 nuclear transport factor 2 family protein [Roseomonas sp. SXEYE001]
MSHSDPIAQTLARVQDVYGRYAQGDRAALYDALAPEVTWTSVGGNGLLPWAGTRQGRAGVAEYFTQLDAEADVTGYDVEQVIAQGQWIAILATVSVRYRRNGQEHRYPKADFLRMVDGMVIDFREFYDTAQASHDHGCGCGCGCGCG